MAARPPRARVTISDSTTNALHCRHTSSFHFCLASSWFHVAYLPPFTASKDSHSRPPSLEGPSPSPLCSHSFPHRRGGPPLPLDFPPGAIDSQVRLK